MDFSNFPDKTPSVEERQVDVRIRFRQRGAGRLCVYHLRKGDQEAVGYLAAYTCDLLLVLASGSVKAADQISDTKSSPTFLHLCADHVSSRPHHSYNTPIAGYHLPRPKISSISALWFLGIVPRLAWAVVVLLEIKFAVLERNFGVN